MSVMLIDGVRYHLRKPSDEEQLEEAVKEHSEEIFGKETIYFDLKHKLSSKSGVASIPDGYVLSLSKPPRWYIVEVELSYHPLQDHITKQISSFYVGIRNTSTQKELVDLLYREICDNKRLKAHVEDSIGSSEVKAFLLDLISKSPTFAVIIEEMGEQVREACQGLKADLIVRDFKTYVRENAPNIHGHLFNPISETTPREKDILKQDIEQKKSEMLEYVKSDELKGIVTECLNRLEQMNLRMKPLSGPGISVYIRGETRNQRFMYVLAKQKFLKVWVLKPNEKWLESNVRNDEELDHTFENKIKPTLKEYKAIA